MANLIAVFKTFPKEIFRVNNGLHVQLRQWAPSRYPFDVIPTRGMVQAKALHPTSYQAPNGASMRPNSPYQHHLVARLFKGNDMVVYAVPRGTSLPHDLILVHERSDHFSLQPARNMTISGTCLQRAAGVYFEQELTDVLDLNEEITGFLLRHATRYTREQWLDTYPAPTDFDHVKGKVNPRHRR